MYRDNAKIEMLERTINSEVYACLAGLSITIVYFFLFYSSPLFIVLWLTVGIASLFISAVRNQREVTLYTLFISAVLGTAHLIVEATLKLQHKYLPERFKIQDHKYNMR